MMSIIRCLLFVSVMIITGSGLGGCVKIDEDERIEIIRRPQIDIDPATPDWDGGGSETID